MGEELAKSHRAHSDRAEPCGCDFQLCAPPTRPSQREGSSLRPPEYQLTQGPHSTANSEGRTFPSKRERMVKCWPVIGRREPYSCRNGTLYSSRGYSMSGTTGAGAHSGLYLGFRTRLAWTHGGLRQVYFTLGLFIPFCEMKVLNDAWTSQVSDFWLTLPMPTGLLADPPPGKASSQSLCTASSFWKNAVLPNPLGACSLLPVQMSTQMFFAETDLYLSPTPLTPDNTMSPPISSPTSGPSQLLASCT